MWTPQAVLANARMHAYIGTLTRASRYKGRHASFHHYISLLIAILFRTPSFYGVIPGGETFLVPQGTLNTIDVYGTGFDWVVDVRSSTHRLFSWVGTTEALAQEDKFRFLLVLARQGFPTMLV